MSQAAPNTSKRTVVVTHVSLSLFVTDVLVKLISLLSMQAMEPASQVNGNGTKIKAAVADASVATFAVKVGLAQMLKGGVIMGR